MTIHATDPVIGPMETNANAYLRYLPTVARGMMGLVFLITGLNGFLNFLPQPKTMPIGAAEFAGALMKAGYMFPLIMATQLIVGVLLLSNRFVPLGLALIAPIVVNIFAFHAFLAPGGIGVAIAVVALEVYLAWTYRESFRPMLAVKPAPPTKWLPPMERGDA